MARLSFTMLIPARLCHLEHTRTMLRVLPSTVPAPCSQVQAAMSVFAEHVNRVFGCALTSDGETLASTLQSLEENIDGMVFNSRRRTLNVGWFGQSNAAVGCHS